MNHNEIESCVIKAKQGNQEALLSIIEQFKPFVFKTAKAFYVSSFETYDMAQIGYMALINAVEKYRTGSNTFSSYACSAIKNAFRYTARENCKFNWDFSLNSPLNSSKENGEEFIDCLEGTENIEEDLLRAEKIGVVRKALRQLPKEEIELINTVYYSDLTLSTYATKKGISYVTASRRKRRILKKLRTYLN